MRTVLDIAAGYLTENLMTLTESFHDESVNQARKYIETNYEKFYVVKGFDELNPPKPADLKAFAAKKVRDIQELIVYPINYGARNEFKWLNSYVLGLTRILYTELNYDKPKFKVSMLSDLKKVYFSAVYARQEGIQNNDSSLMMDKNMNGLSFAELKTKFMPYYEKYHAIYEKNKREYIAANKHTEQKEKSKISMAEGAVYDGAGNIIIDFEEPYHENSFKIGTYNACMIPTHKAAATWNKFTNKTSSNMGCNWCITIPDNSTNWESYGCGDTRTVYFCWKDNFLNLNVKDFNDGSAPYNDWGKSLICVMVNNSSSPDSSIQQVTSRYNHYNGEGKSAQASLGFGDDFCGEAGSEGLNKELAKLLGCSLEDIEEKLVYTGETVDTENNKATAFAEAMESVEYYVDECRFDKFEIVTRLPDNYSILEYYDREYEITIDILFNGTKPVENFTYNEISVIRRGKTINDCIFKVASGNDINIVIGPNINPIFGYAYSKVLQLSKAFEPFGYVIPNELPRELEERYVLCTLNHATGEKCNLYDLQEKHFVFPNSVFLLTAFEDDDLNLVVTTNMANRNILPDNVIIYNINKNTSKTMPAEFIKQINNRLIEEHYKVNYHKGYISAKTVDNKVLFDLYNMKIVDDNVGVSSSYCGRTPNNYALLTIDGDKNHCYVYYKGKKIDEVSSHGAIQQVTINVLYNNKAFMLSMDYDKTYKIYNDGKLVYSESSNDFNSSNQPNIIGNMLIAPDMEDSKTISLYGDATYKYILTNTKTGEKYKDIYFDHWQIQDCIYYNNYTVIGYKLDESGENVSYVFINSNDTVVFTNEKYNIYDLYEGFAFISSGDCDLIVFGGTATRNTGHTDIPQIEFVDFNESHPLIYKKDGTLFLDYKKLVQERSFKCEFGLLPLGYGFWLIRTARRGYNDDCDSMILDKDGNILIGNNKDTTVFDIDILKGFTDGNDLKFYVTYLMKNASYNETSPTYTLSKNGEIKILRESMSILTKAALLLG